MRRLLASVLLLVAADAAAQGFTGSISAGLTATTFSGERSYDPKLGFGGGGGLGYDFGNGLLAQVEAFYLVKGALTDAAVEEVPSRVRFRYTYLEVPVTLGYRLPTGRRLEPRLFAGGFWASGQDGRIDVRAKGSTLEQASSDPFFEDRDYGLVAGVSADYDIGSERFFVALRTSYGLADVRAQPTRLRNRGLFVMGGFTF